MKPWEEYQKTTPTKPWEDYQKSSATVQKGDGELKYRGTILPVGRTQDGQTVLAWPQWLHEPYKAASDILSGQKDYTSVDGKDVLALGGAYAGNTVGSAAVSATKPAIQMTGRALKTVTSPVSHSAGAVRRVFDQDAAYNHIMNTTLDRAMMTTDDVLAEAAKGQAATKFGGNSKAFLPETLADLGGEATQSLLEQTVIAPGRARTIVRDRLNDRQTGSRSVYDTSPAPRKITDQQMTFGQRHRLLDNMARAFELKTKDSALQSEKQITARMREEAAPKYAAAWSGADDFDLTAPVERTLADMRNMPDGSLRRLIGRHLKLFLDDTSEEIVPISQAADLQKFDFAKQELDDTIQKLKKSGRNQAAMYLDRMRVGLLDAVHGGSRTSPTRNVAYSEARELYAGASQLKEAIQMGRDAFREGAEVTAEQISGLTASEMKLFRRGLYEATRRKVSKKPTDDATQHFRQDNAAEIIKAAMPNSRKIKRSDNFGELLAREQRMAGTRGRLANSRTAFRLEGQKDFDRMAAFMDRLRKNGATSAVVDTVGQELQQFFGMREALAARIADLLTDPDPKRIEAAMKSLKKNTPQQNYQHVDDYMTELMSRVERAAVIQSSPEQMSARDSAAYHRGELM